MSAVSFSKHNHARCIKTSVAAAKSHCESVGARLTPTRLRVFEILLQEHRALGAYDVLNALQKEGYAAQPPVAYRALEFLLEQGLAHKIERLNAFVACAHPSEQHSPTFLICRDCASVAETCDTNPTAALDNAAASVGFQIENTVIELEGLCPKCQ